MMKMKKKNCLVRERDIIGEFERKKIKKKL